MNETQSLTESLLEIVNSIISETILLPEFQRDFRWELEKTYDLIDSLIKDIFIGTVIYGKPAFTMTLRAVDTRQRKRKSSQPPPETFNYSKDEILNLTKTQNLRIVLDGQQRITSIYRAITGVDSVYIILHAHLSNETVQKISLEDMVQKVQGEESISEISVKLSDAYYVDKRGLDDEEIDELFAKTSYAKNALKNADENLRKNSKKLYRRAIRQLIDLYKQQKLVAFYLLDMSLDKFCTFFERSNSKAIPLNFTDILAAKLYRGFNLKAKIEDFESQYQDRFILNREIIIRAIAYIAAENENKPVDIDRNFILNNLDESHFNKYWDTACNLYADSLTYLANQHFILSQSWMPSENMIIPLMIFLRQVKGFDRMKEEQRQFIEFWYWSSIFANRYSTSSNETIVMDCGVLSQVAHNQHITARNFFVRLRPLIKEKDDLFGYTKKASTIYKGILNLLGYTSHGLKNWNNTQTIDITMALEDHHIYPRGYISSKPILANMDAVEAQDLVDCVVNRTLIPKSLNVQIGKKPPVEYLSELKKKNNSLADCLSSHIIPLDMIEDKIWNTHFKLFLEERAERIFELIKHVTVDMTPEILTRYSTQIESSEHALPYIKPRLKDLIAEGKVTIGEKVYIRKYPEKIATIVDGDTVQFQGKNYPINHWGQIITGWTSISIYNHVFLDRTQQSLEKLRENPLNTKLS